MNPMNNFPMHVPPNMTPMIPKPKPVNNFCFLDPDKC